jgi:hypothetical protein
MTERNTWTKGWRGAVLILVGIVMGANLITPAVAHIGSVTHLWKTHLKPKVNAFGEARWRTDARGAAFSYRDGPYPTVTATAAKVAEVTLNAPRNGFALVEYAHTDFAQVNAQTITSWLERNPTTDCDGAARITRTESLDTIPGGTFSSSSGTAVIQASQGAHRIVLCAVAGADGTQIGVASVNATFYARGASTTIIPTAPSGTRGTFGG